MKRKAKPVLTVLSLFMALLFAFPHMSSAQNDQAMKGLDSIKAVFDFRDDNPESALVHLQLIHQTFKDPALRKISDRPDFVVVFMGKSVKLLSKNRGSFSPEQQKLLDKMDQTISAMAKDGITLEVCLFAAHFFGVDPGSFPQEIQSVDNGWISSIGYQANGYSLVPVY